MPLSIASSYAISCMGMTAPRAVIGPLDGITIGFASSPSANSNLSVMMITSYVDDTILDASSGP